MAYNRLGSPHREGPYSPSANPHYDSRSPSPGRPLQPYAHPDESFTRQQPLHLQMPTASHDRLAMQPTYSVENINNSQGHNRQYEQQYPAGGDMGYARNDYVVSPEDHHDSYYNQPYSPHPQGDYALDPYPTPGEPYRSDHDTAPILQPDSAYGPDPHSQPGMDDDGYHDEPRPTPSPAPIRRWKTVKEVQLFNGNLVLDCPVPPKLLAQVPHAQPPERDEFTHMRYSAATCDPSEFYNERFTLRQRLFAKPRQTELFLVVTMYNEDEFLFARTMIGIFKNIDFMCNRGSSKTWGKEAWKKIVVCIVSDGRAKINPRTRAVLAGLGVYQDGIAKQQVNGKDVTAHIYEYTTQVGLELKGTQVLLKPRSPTPVQLLFCLKEKNQKKINSHRWFFQAFGRVLDPNICVLIDAGTKPGKDSIYQLWKAFDLEPMCGGACGEIKVMLDHGKKLYNPLIATQNFEYKMSNILDKPLESAFGFISVLPGAFSAYRYVALQNDKNGEGPLEKYFKGEFMHAEAGVFTANMYLAEDRILCFELVSKRNCRWILQYVKSATGETDVPDKIPEFVLQRRRWLNGSFFAAVYAVTHVYQLWRSDHSAIRKLMFLIEFMYQTINMLFAWFAIGNFFLVFRLLTASLGSPGPLGTAGTILGVVFEFVYLGTLLYCFILSMGNRPTGSKKSYLLMVIFWSLLMCWLTFASIFLTVKSIQTEVSQKDFSFSTVFNNSTFFGLIVSLASTYVLWFVASFLFFDPWHMFTCFLQYIVLTPTYINVLNIYAFCNTHDITWGTKGDDKAEKLESVTVKADGKLDVAIPQDDGDLNAQYDAELTKFATKPVKEVKKVNAADKQEDYYKSFRSNVVTAWMITNFILAAAVLNTAGFDRINTNDTEQQNSTIYLAVILWSVAGLSLFRFIGACWFLVVRLFRGV
ncbi:Chitin synthase, class 2 [Exophiala xenobiotica]|uniref:Chitin synthase n=1 Tax=Vermiconidia calcicola TaxID=1690605 RepID=A0AAV9Q3J8_9PEZI|nr:Chitin synthase, class 2 [Exophiala xenobiotica]KAK5533323.1 Chitin synthase, class 2 [Vermiconidia calcicola]KAK5534277.1 Chitin synthase, class 2 [Chaetothyriales sp. CCFEE 6169]KAK5189362.1 Chitin synthase, class 2 [Exophiala xenobiotica]KAK5205780.1 Chitin synthase, class 2 [Exophiala xenobiotica]